MTAGDVYRALWRHKVFIAVLTAVFVGATWYATKRETQMYEASALVRVQERGSGDAASELQASQTLAQIYAKIIDSGALRKRIAKLLAGKVAPGALSEVNVSAQPVQDLDLLTITTRSRNPQRATIVATATPSALAAFIDKSGSKSEQISTVNTTEGSAVSKHLALNVALALILGLIFNGALALVLELVRDRLPEPDELGRTVGHPVLATIPSLRLHGVAPIESAGSSTEAALALDTLGDEAASPQGSSRLGSEP